MNIEQLETDEAAKGNGVDWEKEMEPNWHKVLPIMLSILERGTEKGKEAARAELARMADLANRYVNIANGVKTP